jgi:hypothetical protein
MIKTHELRQSGAELAAVFAPLVRDGFLAVCEGGVELSKVRRRLLAVRVHVHGSGVSNRGSVQ